MQRTTPPVKVDAISGAQFLQFLTRFGRSDEAGPIASQFEAALRADEEHHGAFAVFACGQIVGALSWGVVALPRGAGAVSGRLDTVVTRPDIRRAGLGGLLMNHFIVELHHQHGDKLVHLSTIAMHSAVKSWATRLGFEHADVGNLPLFQIALDDDGERQRVVKQAERELHDRVTGLRLRCAMCMRTRGQDQWCNLRINEARP